MRTLFDGKVFVSYRQIYVDSGSDFGGDMYATFAGQSNGLCGGAVPGLLFLVTGLHTGDVTFTVELHESAPPVDDSWEDIVEVSFTPAGPKVSLDEWDGESWPLELAQVPYRVRYSATGMDAGAELDTPDDDDLGPDRYLLQFWPDTPRPDAVVKQTSDQADYWHGVGRRVPAPSAPAAEPSAR
ncbi:hypothetical protein [Actinoallomurus soli]|uniref:hypothetical protein n=1 Tax=Actinoallomurus soli TaxID=2952535 RepID=UPI002093B387|nr:hypothetical protein [Actinoallomurus soli]MCO5968195.1 hypothetical protein [Actinoallomurus soli]